MELEKIKGLGDKYIKLLNSLNIYNVQDLLMYYPFRYDIYKLSDISLAKDKESVTVLGRVDSVPISRYIRSRLNVLSFRVFTGNKLVNVSIYNRAFMKRNLTPGREVTIIGKYDAKRNTIVASNILLEEIKDGTINGVYHLKSGITNKQISKFISDAYVGADGILDYVPEDLNQKYNFITKKEAIRKIHFPESIDEIKEAKLKLIYEELFIFMFKINYLKYIKTGEVKKVKKECNKSLLQDFLTSLPFELTEDQTLAVMDIYNDTVSDRRMNRLICGDVGSGKTVVGLTGVFVNYIAGYQSALMAPTEILANQHYNNIKNLLSNTNINVRLLSGNTKKKERIEIYEGLKDGSIDLLIGTHAIISNKVEFKNLGLVITDEQHRFGVNQRESLRNKGLLPDILYMSATPIPRTYALTIYGDMDISLIKTKPKGRKEIKTIVKSDKEIKDVLYGMLGEIKKGHQVYVVSPLIDEGENTDLVPVTELKEKIEIAFNGKVSVGLLHGKLDKEEKDKVMNDFVSGKIKVLVSTTVIEVGVDNPNATMMVIFNADRFGLATLHQLRGRIGRNSLDSYCILIGPKNDRLKVLEESTDGFYITEKDFEMRREGDLFGVRQSGDMAFKIADIKKDFKVLLKAKEDSMIFLEENIRKAFKNNEKYYKIVNEMKSLD